jgi:hypothetical protein
MNESPREAKPSTTSPSVEDALPAPIRSRAELAAFLLERADEIRAVARRKLTNVARSSFDSEDVLSSVVRRMDKLFHDGRLQVATRDELWRLVQAVTSNRAVSFTRLRERMKQLGAEGGAYEQHLANVFSTCESDDEAILTLYQVAARLAQPADRQLFLLRARGANHRAAAAVLGTSEEAARQRWASVRRQISEIVSHSKSIA